MVFMYVRGSFIRIDAGISSSILISIVLVLSLYLIPSLLSPNRLLANSLSVTITQDQPQNNSQVSSHYHNSEQTKLYPELDTSELNKIKQRGTLRIIVPANLSINALSKRIISPLHEQQQLAMEFANSLGVSPELIPMMICYMH